MMLAPLSRRSHQQLMQLGFELMRSDKLPGKL